MTREPESEIAASEELVGEGTRSFVRMLRYLFSALRILIVVVLVGIVFGGFFDVAEHEHKMVFRFGKLIKKDGQEVLTSDKGKLYWSWPYPINKIKAIPAHRSVTITTEQFWPTKAANVIRGSEAAEAPPPGGPGEGLKPGEAGYLLTGDANIMHTVWSVVYRVTDAKTYYLGLYEDGDTHAVAHASKRQQNSDSNGHDDKNHRQHNPHTKHGYPPKALCSEPFVGRRATTCSSLY